MIGKTIPELGGSEYLKVIHGQVRGDAPHLDLDYEKKNQQAVLDLIQAGLVKSCHDLSEGGMAVALAECCLSNREMQIGCKVIVPGNLRPDILLFGESQSRFIISSGPHQKIAVQNMLKERQIDFAVIGLVAGHRLIINEWINAELEKLDDLYFNSIDRLMRRTD
jgi:phosphoribosylformylglycinamidine synthase